jgi:hypothetical protein
METLTIKKLRREWGLMLTIRRRYLVLVICYRERQDHAHPLIDPGLSQLPRCLRC